MRSMRWFRRVAVSFAVFQAIGYLAALAAGFTWARTVTLSTWPPQSFVVQALASALVATLASWAAWTRGPWTSRLWWSAIALATADLVVALIRVPASADDWAELGGVVVVAVLAALALRPEAPPSRIATGPALPPGQP